LHDEGATIVLVTHDMPIMQRFCDRALLLEAGLIDCLGDPGDVGRRYLELNFERRRREPAPLQAGGADVWVQRGDGGRADSIPQGEPLTLRAAIEVSEHVERPVLGLWLESASGLRVFSATSDELDIEHRPLAPGDRLRLQMRAENPLASGRYFIGCTLARNGNPEDLVLYQPRVADFLIYGGDPVDGLVVLDHELELELESEKASR
jgi:energy-coupling factor transporter ATP-binding protein EcfA2